MSLQQVETSNPQVGDSREREHRLFQEVTDALVECENCQIREPMVEKAVERNRRLWDALKVDLSLNENRLPDELKAKLISIAIWVEKHSDKVLKGSGEVEPLITVNQAIIDGLAA